MLPEPRSHAHCIHRVSKQSLCGATGPERVGLDLQNWSRSRAAGRLHHSPDLGSGASVELTAPRSDLRTPPGRQTAGSLCPSETPSPQVTTALRAGWAFSPRQPVPQQPRWPGPSCHQGPRAPFTTLLWAQQPSRGSVGYAGSETWLPTLAPRFVSLGRCERTEAWAHLSPLGPVPRCLPLTGAPRTSASVAMTQS